MKIKFDAHKSPHQPSDERQVKMHPRLVGSQVRTSTDLARAISAGCTITPADVAGVLSALASYMESELTAGNVVRLDGIGSFGIIPEFKDAIYEGDRYDGGDVQVKSLHFRPDRTLLGNVKLHARFARTDSHQSRSVGVGDAYLFLQKYLADHDRIDTIEFMHALGLKKDKAHRLLRDLVSRNKLHCHKEHGVNYYVLY